MKDIHFIKAEGLGNDFIFIEVPSPEDLHNPPPVDILRHLAHRRKGIGCDQIIFFYVGNIDQTTHHAIYLSFYNADGTEAPACGNGSRALSHYLYEEKRISSSLIGYTKGGIFYAEPLSEEDKKEYPDCSVAMTFPYPNLTPPEDLCSLPLVPHQKGNYMYGKMGNPHLICFVPSVDDIFVQEWGPRLSKDPLFPEGVNVSFATCLANQHIDLKVWERGAGFTGACGTGACATFAAALSQRAVKDTDICVHQPGGVLILSRTGSKSAPQIKMIGPAKTVYKGVISMSL